AQGDIDIVVTATDARGASANQSFRLSIGPRVNDPPRIVSVPTGPAITGHPWSYQVEAFDSDNDALQYSLDSAAIDAGMRIDRRTGRLTYTPQSTGSQSATITVTDGYGGTTEQRFLLDIVDATSAGRAPQFLSAPRGPAILSSE